MRVALAMVVRDEADVMEKHLRLHLGAGVDFVLATDHGSTDGTHQIQKKHERDGDVRRFQSVAATESFMCPPSRSSLPDDGRPFAERMTVQLSPVAPINDPAGPYWPVATIACRVHERRREQRKP